MTSKTEVMAHEEARDILCSAFVLAERIQGTKVDIQKVAMIAINDSILGEKLDDLDQAKLAKILAEMVALVGQD